MHIGGRRHRSPRVRTRKAVGRLVDRHQIVRGPVDESTFVMLLDLELERARRHGRSFCLSLFDVSDLDATGVEPNSQLAGQTRTCDAATVVDGQLVILWAESDRAAAATAIGRVERNSELRMLRTVSFPAHAFTRADLWSELFSGRDDEPVTVRTPTVSAGERTTRLA